MNKLKIFKRALIVILIFGFACSIYGDGFIVIPKPPRPHPHPWPRFNPFPLEVKYHKVNVKIEGQVATTYIDQVFYNPSRRRLEGYYLFPIPKNSFNLLDTIDEDGTVGDNNAGWELNTTTGAFQADDSAAHAIW